MDIRRESSVEAIKQAILDNLNFSQGRIPVVATRNDWYMALSYTVRDRILDRWIRAMKTLEQTDLKIVMYLSAEFLMGPHLGNALVNLGIYEQVREALCGLGLSFDDLMEQEEEPGLGNGGLGRLAACYMDSLATLGVPAIGYGIRYEFGMFDQEIKDGRQVEKTDKWLKFGNPWEMHRPEIAYYVNLGGHTESFYDSKTISKVLYPNDEPDIGKTLRLAQQYFFVSCSLQDMIRLHGIRGKDLETFHQSVAIQMNDTHPSIAVAELMRLFIDVHQMDWDKAWHITENSLAYTNHTLLSEALEKWSLPFFQRLLPRHLEIIYEINHRFLEKVRSRYPEDVDLTTRLSIIDERGEKKVRMAHLACVGSHRINGVSALNTELLSKTVLKDFHDLYPERFLNVTNGVTPRRWIVLSNPNLTRLITTCIGDKWIRSFEEEIIELEPFAGDSDFRKQWQEIKAGNNINLARIIKERTGIVVDGDSLFDIQVKRIHEYKRQHLNVLHIITVLNSIKNNPAMDITPLHSYSAERRHRDMPWPN